MIGATILLMLASGAEPAAAPAQSAEDKVRCIRRAETGSLVKKTKICHTIAEWRRIEDIARRDGEYMTRPGHQPPGN